MEKTSLQKWRERNPEKRKEYNRRYYEKHKEFCYEITRRYRENHREEIAARQREYYNKNKEKVLAQQKEYNKRNRKKITQWVLNHRKEVAERLKEEGQIYVYLSKTERQNKMTKSLGKKLNISEEQAKQLLEENGWNYKKLVGEQC